MIPFYKSLPLVAAVIFLACKAPSKLYELHTMQDFNIDAGNSFVNYIRQMPNIDAISVVDRKNNGNDFFVNNQSIFLDTIQQDKPNYYSYKKRAGEINIAADSLLRCVQLFDKIGVNEFGRNDGFYCFRVVVGFTTNRGYLYTNQITAKTGDTLIATSSRNKAYEYKVILNKQLDQHWFEYYERPY